MVLRFFGRKTGRRYDIPVVAHRLDGELYALTDAPWRNNFRDGADVEVTLDGHVTRMREQLPSYSPTATGAARIRSVWPATCPVPRHRPHRSNNRNAGVKNRVQVLTVSRIAPRW